MNREFHLYAFSERSDTLHFFLQRTWVFVVILQILFSEDTFHIYRKECKMRLRRCDLVITEPNMNIKFTLSSFMVRYFMLAATAYDSLISIDIARRLASLSGYGSKTFNQ